MTSQGEKYMTIGQVANRIGVHQNTVRRWIKEKDFPYFQPVKRGYYRFKWSDVEAWLESQQESK